MNAGSCPNCNPAESCFFWACRPSAALLICQPACPHGPGNASSIPAGWPSLPEETQPLAELLMPWNAAQLSSSWRARVALDKRLPCIINHLTSFPAQRQDWCSAGSATGMLPAGQGQRSLSHSDLARDPRMQILELAQGRTVDPTVRF